MKMIVTMVAPEYDGVTVSALRASLPGTDNWWPDDVPLPRPGESMVLVWRSGRVSVRRAVVLRVHDLVHYPAGLPTGDKSPCVQVFASSLGEWL